MQAFIICRKPSRVDMHKLFERESKARLPYDEMLTSKRRLPRMVCETAGVKAYLPYHGLALAHFSKARISPNLNQIVLHRIHHPSAFL
jgi:hypothetical protein